MIRIAFWMDCPAEYAGGLNYVRNLLYALSLVEDKDLDLYVFFGTKVDDRLISGFRPYAKIVKTSILDRKSALWFIHKVCIKLFNSFLIVNVIMRKFGIQVLSHAWNYCGNHPHFRVLGWIPDFQYLHLPEFFPGLDSEAETARMLKMIAHSEMVLLSSLDALNDFKRIAPGKFLPRARVLPFVSQPNSGSATGDPGSSAEEIERKYGVKGDFFFLPNQFWAHKNHIVVFEAVKLLKEQGKNIQVICTGNLYDYRLKNTSYADSLSDFISDNNLQHNIKILGLIDYADVLWFMRESLAVLNPSRFEGWSSSVEEAKSIGKPIVLSKINVHVEQNPPKGYYFVPDDPIGLSRILDKIWSAPHNHNSAELELEARRLLHARTLEYATAYIKLVNELAGQPTTDSP